MTKRMLIDASHAEETRVVVLDGNRLEDFDVETASRRQLKGNIYLAKVVRVEPSLQAAFVEYGGNRHGFLAFGEIHPDYYQIPVADRQRLLAMQEEEARAEEEAEEAQAHAEERRREAHGIERSAAHPEFDEAGDGDRDDAGENSQGDSASIARAAEPAAQPLVIEHEILQGPAPEPSADAAEETRVESADALPHETLGADIAPEAVEPASYAPLSESPGFELLQSAADEPDLPYAHDGAADLAPPAFQTPAFEHDETAEAAPRPATVGGDPDANDEVRERRIPSRALRSYKIQEVIRRRQILLVQVVKEERGTKGAALTTYISLAGRYCVLMPNSPRGGGISRKITSASDRRRLKEVTAELDIPRGMGLIVRTAGAARPKPEIKRDCEYLLRLWDDIRDQTMASIAPALIYEEASLIKRAIRDVYSRDVDELLIDGEEGWRTAREFMRMLMPTHVKKVELWRNPQPLFAQQNVEALLDSMLSPTVQLRSGGYLVINQTEALVAIDVNSGRSTRERGIEETALRTNLEAADEAARQLRLRDLAGLIVIDFIDMESKKHNAMVERRMGDALKNDRARIQVGHISPFGLMELSRQRLRPSLAETSLTICPHCGGLGHVRSTESAALHVLRAIEEEGGRRRSAEILVHVAGDAALYILNNKRQRLSEIEARYAMRVNFAADPLLLPAQTRIERLRAHTSELPPPPERSFVQQRDDQQDEPEPTAEELAADADVVEGAEPEAEAAPAVAASSHASDPDAVPGETAEEGERRRRRRRRRRGRGRREDSGTPVPDGAEQPDLPDVAFVSAMPGVEVPLIEPPALPALEAPEPSTPASTPVMAAPPAADEPLATNLPPAPGHDEAGEVAVAAEVEQAPKRKRGGRRRKPREEEAATPPLPLNGSAATYNGPTPADPFASGHLDIFDIMDAHETRRAEAPAPAPVAQEAPEATPAVPAAPPIQPVLVGSAEPAERKRGWWRR
jgi:ribonuclease E